MASCGHKVDLCYEDIVELKLRHGIRLVDVREHSEVQETGKLPDSVHIPLGELAASLQLAPEEFEAKYGAERPDKDSPIVFSCRSGNRSRKAMSAALELGFANSRHYAGGFQDWQERTSRK